jgi:hypothetical protein
MMQSYAFIHKNNVFSAIFVLNFIKSNNMKVNSGELAATQLRVTAIFVNFDSSLHSNNHHPISNLSILVQYQTIR